MWKALSMVYRIVTISLVALFLSLCMVGDGVSANEEGMASSEFTDRLEAINEEDFIASVLSEDTWEEIIEGLPIGFRGAYQSAYLMLTGDGVTLNTVISYVWGFRLILLPIMVWTSLKYMRGRVHTFKI